MKRHPDLLQLSREHHVALKLARDARRAAASGDANELRQRVQHVIDLFAAELDPHFRVEEQGILVLLAQAGEHALVRRTRSEHEELRRLVGTLARPAADTLSRFAELLAAHVRFEERELFETAQKNLAASQAGVTPAPPQRPCA